MNGFIFGFKDTTTILFKHERISHIATQIFMLAIMAHASDVFAFKRVWWFQTPLMNFVYIFYKFRSENPISSIEVLSLETICIN